MSIYRYYGAMITDYRGNPICPYADYEVQGDENAKRAAEQWLYREDNQDWIKPVWFKKIR